MPMRESTRHAIEKKYGPIAVILYEATLLKLGWEMDNYGWVVRMETGAIMGFTTNHNSLQEWSRGEMEDDLANTLAAAATIEAAMKALDGSS